MIFREHRTRILPVLGAFTAVALAAQDASAQAIVYTKQGAASDRLGASVASAGDHNNDTNQDFIIGIPENFIVFTAGEGRATVFSGANGSEIRTYHGDNFFDEFGASVSDAGDVNNDGIDDVIVGAPFVDNGGNLGAGMARVFSGAGGATLYTFFGAATGDQFGDSVSGAGDVNNDGFDDVIVGAVFHDGMSSDVGMARVYSGANGAILYTVLGSGSNDLTAISVSDAGDVNNDNFDDFIVGSANAGAKVYSGQNGAVLHNFTGPSSDQYGRAVASAGDVNNDGNDDVIIGAPQDSPLSPGNGYAEIRSGADGSILQSFMGSSMNDRFGISVAGARDLNADGHDDVLVGADQSVNGDGYVRAYSGMDGSLLLNYIDNNPSANIRLGTSVDGLGDVDQSGTRDIIVGAPLDSAAATGAGTARVISVGGGPACPPPTTYCIAGVNSFGTACQINSTGSTSIAANDFGLTATGAAPLTFGLFFYGPTQIQASVGMTFRCVGAGGVGLFRLGPPVMTSASGAGARAVNYNTYPANDPASFIGAGATWNFQFFYRDGGAPNMINFSNGLNATFCP